MNRRDFLRGMAGILAFGVAPAVVGSNILMPIRQIVLPTDEEVFRVLSGILTPQMIARETLRILEQNLCAMKCLNADFEKQFLKVGDLLTIRGVKRCA